MTPTDAGSEETGVRAAAVPAAAAGRPGGAKFLTGSLMRHVAVMTLTSSIGLLALFVVDFVNLFFISRLGDPALTAGIGFASTLLFLNSSLNIGLMITISALAARRIGMGQHGRVGAGRLDERGGPRRVGRAVAGDDGGAEQRPRGEGRIEPAGQPEG